MRESEKQFDVVSRLSDTIHCGFRPVRARYATRIMNYHHAYHAGNFADVLKHAALVAVLTHLRKKETPFAVIDTHGGRGNIPRNMPRSRPRWRGPNAHARSWAMAIASLPACCRPPNGAQLC